jgi:hypothetical protein
MAFANTSITDILATTIESRSRVIADNVTKNNALLARLSQKGNIKPFSGGHKILEELSFAENGNAAWYSGYDTLAVAAQDVISAAEYSIKQAAVPVIISGLEQLQNSGKEALIDLMESRLAVAEASLANLIAGGLYSDGTGSGGKQLTGLLAAVAASPATGTYGGIDRATWTFWRNQVQSSGGLTTSNILTQMNTLYAKLVRGMDRPDLIPCDSAFWGTYMGALQPLQRFTSADTANLGFTSVKFMDADVVLDGGIGGFAPASTAFFLNTKYLKFRPHKDRNMVALSPSRRTSINQDAEVQILAFAGNLTCSGAQFLGRLS